MSDYFTPENEGEGMSVKITDDRWLSCANDCDDPDVHLIIWGEGVDSDFKCENCGASGGVR